MTPAIVVEEAVEGGAVTIAAHLAGQRVSVDAERERQPLPEFDAVEDLPEGLHRIHVTFLCGDQSTGWQSTRQHECG